MPSGWSGTLRELRQLIAGNRIEPVLTGGFSRLYGRPSSSELESWTASLPALLDALPGPEFDPLQVILEMQMPIGAERADVVLLGGRKKDPRAMVVELKQWSSAKLEPATFEVGVSPYGLCQHPSAQALNYRGKLQLFHSKASGYKLAALAFLHNMEVSQTVPLTQGYASALAREAPLLGKGDTEKLASLVRSHLLPSELDPSEHEAFSDAPYMQTRHLFDVITRHASDIANRAVVALAEAGMGLTEEQEILTEEVLAAAKAKSGEVFAVQGGPGSGKTLLAVTLLLRALKQGTRCVLAIRNNRLQAILRRCFDEAFPGASGTMVYFEVPRTQTGIGDAGFQKEFDLVICDEAQRMRSVSMPIVLRRAPTSVIFLDETQRLNPPEQGTLVNFSRAAEEVGRRPQAKQLRAAIRCRGGQPYHDWVEALLSEPQATRSLHLAKQPWREHYRFESCDSVEEMIERLGQLRDSAPGRRVAMVASATEAPGNINRVTAPDNLRIGYPLTSGWDYYRDSNLHINWLMQPNEYVKFWLNGGSNNLNRVASIYGAQGFESDYVGVIWGRDMVFRDGAWQLGDPDVCVDTIDGLVSRRGAKKWCAEALPLLKNRYRIFLTRGIMGTCVFCEDGATRKHLQTLR